MSSTYEGLRYKVCMNLLPFAIVLYYFFLLILIGLMPLRILVYIYIYIGFKTFFYVVRHLDPIASCLPTQSENLITGCPSSKEGREMSVLTDNFLDLPVLPLKLSTCLIAILLAKIYILPHSNQPLLLFAALTIL